MLQAFNTHFTKDNMVPDCYFHLTNWLKTDFITTEYSNVASTL